MLFTKREAASRWIAPLLLLLSSSIPCLADQEAFFQDEKYNHEDYGRWVTQKYKTSSIEPPRLNFMQPFTECDDGSYLFIAPRGDEANASFYIMDHEGALVWGPDRWYGQVYNFQVQQYRGEPYLTFWAGNDAVGGHGEGKYYMLDRHYQEHGKISAGKGIRGDLHSFYITEDETAIFTAYEPVQADLSSVGREEDAWIWESLFQELDIETGKVLFQWRASQHFPFTDVYADVNKAVQNSPWDFFHINQVEKDKFGNFLVSTRYGRCALYVAGRDHENPGQVLWQLGGKHNSFEDLSGGDATTFLGQHDIHWLDDAEGNHKAITMFDNRADWSHKLETHPESKGHRIEVDLVNITASLTTSYLHPAHILSTSQGSMQVLPNGHVVMGYGFNGVMTEFSSNGTALCDAYFVPQKGFERGWVQSYRNLKANWTGIPLTTPNTTFEDGTFYVSWVGSTKVRSWLLQDAGEADGQFASVQSVPKKGLETEVHLADVKRMRQYVRAIAMDVGGTQLSTSAVIDVGDPIEIWGELREDEEPPHHDDHNKAENVSDSSVLFALGIFALVSAVLVAWFSFGRKYMPAGMLQSEKLPFRDDSWFMEKARSIVPGARRSWRDETSHHRLRGEEDGDSSFDLDSDDGTGRSRR